ncbi:hypothetical protein KC909_03800 [Candidatus Dojkabacteria bacterium]|uniref:Fibronectin type-III domain-containing protein n=1 Tax=Candidatus Dojkabacteria bacterium TaxID=2099670 RepID=A0A955L5L3_9BACT|nr:hypothetical protein [Candidatus Dojkabacteria bacterium]
MKRLFLVLTIILASFAALVPTTVSAETQNFEITANSGGTSTYQGNFQPASISVNEGDTVNITFTVPMDDPYCCGAQITGNGGEFDTGTIQPGESKQVSFTAVSSFGFTSYWPGTGAVKATGSVNVTPAAEPQAPGVPQSFIGNSISTTQIKLQWNSAQGATAYKVFRNGELVATVSTLFFDDNSLTPATSYAYKLQATDGNLDSGFTDEITVTTKTPVQQNQQNNQETNESTDQASDTDNVDEALPTPAPTGGVDVQLVADIYVDPTQRYVEINDIAWGYNEIPEIEKGDKFEVFGRTVANADVLLTVYPGEITYTAVSDADGFWYAEIETDLLQGGTNSLAIDISNIDMEGMSQEVISFQVLGDENVDGTPDSYPNGSNDVKDYLWIIFLILGGIFILVGIVLGIRFVLSPKKKSSLPVEKMKPVDPLSKPVSQLDSLLQNQTIDNEVASSNNSIDPSAP